MNHPPHTQEVRYLGYGPAISNNETSAGCNQQEAPRDEVTIRDCWIGAAAVGGVLTCEVLVALATGHGAGDKLLIAGAGMAAMAIAVNHVISSVRSTRKPQN